MDQALGNVPYSWKPPDILVKIDQLFCPKVSPGRELLLALGHTEPRLVKHGIFPFYSLKTRVYKNILPWYA